MLRIGSEIAEDKGVVTLSIEGKVIKILATPTEARRTAVDLIRAAEQAEMIEDVWLSAKDVQKRVDSGQCTETTADTAVK